MAAYRGKMVVLKSGEECRLRSPLPGEAGAVLDFIRPVLEDHRFFVMRPEDFTLDEAGEEEWIARHLANPDWIVIGAFRGRELVGIVHFENQPLPKIAHRGQLHMSVDEKWRSRGVGAALLEALVDWAAENPRLEKLCLSVFHDNRVALGLYRKLGFVEEGRLARSYRRGPGDYADEVLMYRMVD